MIMGMSNKHAKTLYRRQSMYTVLYLNIPFPHYVFLNVFATFFVIISEKKKDSKQTKNAERNEKK